MLPFNHTTTTPYYCYTSVMISPWQSKTTTVSNATPSVSVTPSISDTSDSVIALGVSVGVLLILTTVSVIINIYCFIKYCKYSIDRRINEGIKEFFSATKQIKTDYDIAMQVHEPYELHALRRKSDEDIEMHVCEPYEHCSAKTVQVIEEIYAECKASPNYIADEDYI
ncbi:PREDICTED: uncharacterized protein LOC109582355 [Amphimedon queenslandica]|uniref:Uncharacterized protein n=1 Tax=Amphimedon queenslandica TaxID=400682 RepID=A0AAN0J744_AMPQE|nr:PREDICTED: uncharacterized protein LOC109582355 [Amphimedon queenslandica]|eukprot:XP_019852582.1 PREDICTED: uncharacterized protein LOC109582355 [Amphimedon queenslandica]